MFVSNIQTLSGIMISSLQTLFPLAIAEKVKDVAFPFFKCISSIYLSAFGTVEIKQLPKKTSVEDKNNLQKSILSASSIYLNRHGALTIGSGIFSLLDALHEFGVIGLSRAAEIVSITGSVLFLGASIIALEENVRLFNEIEDNDWTETNIDPEELYLIKQSASWGILSNLGYIAATAALLFSGATAITIVLATLSCFAGGVKFLYHVAEWRRSKKEMEMALPETTA